MATTYTPPVDALYEFISGNSDEFTFTRLLLATDEGVSYLLMTVPLTTLTLEDGTTEGTREFVDYLFRNRIIHELDDTERTIQGLLSEIKCYEGMGD